jgi:hypothetical protein
VPAVAERPFTRRGHFTDEITASQKRQLPTNVVRCSQ